MFNWAVAYIISEWVLRIVMLAVVPSRRKPAAAVAWLLIIFSFPWVGFLLYLMIGSTKLPWRRRKRYVRMQKAFDTLAKRFVQHPHIVTAKLRSSEQNLISLSEKLGKMPILADNDVDLFSDNDDVINNMIADINSAENHVHVMFYIFGNDELAMNFAAALVAAAKRGLKVRVLADYMGSWSTFTEISELLSANGVECYEMLPVGPFRRHSARVDLRNHRKLLIIDGKLAYTGSQNIHGKHFESPDLSWRDIMVRITGPVVLELQFIFSGDWYLETEEVLDGDEFFPKPLVTGDTVAQTLPSGPNYEMKNFLMLIISALYTAKKRVVIITPYFVPNDALVTALQVAAIRGVNVEMILPRRSDIKMIDIASRAYYEYLLQAGVRIHLFEGGVLHAKSMSIDDNVAFIGSGNLDIRSFALAFEVSMLFYGEATTKKLGRVEQDFLRQSTELTLEEWQKRPAYKSMIQNIVKLLSPLL